MATTFYSNELHNQIGSINTYDRVKVVYTTSTTPNKFTISATSTLQHKGTTGSGGNPRSYFGISGTVSDTLLSDATPPSSIPAYSNWTDVVSGSGSATYDRLKSGAQTYYIGAALGIYSPSYTRQTVVIPQLENYNVSYNANGGSGAPGNQTKWYNESLSLSTVTPSRTNYVFKNWNTNSAGTGTTYNPGGTYTGNAALTLYAQWYAPYTVSYNANGGSGAPGNQVKVYNQNLTITTDKPTKTNFVFVEWNTASDGSGTSYQPGATYSSNADLSLYAIWKAEPIINTLTAIRCDDQGVEDSEGEYALVTCEWFTDGSLGETGTISGTVTPQGSSTPTSFTFSSGSSGYGTLTAVAIVGQNNGIQLSPDNQYTISVTVANGIITNSRNVILTRAFFTMDWKAGGYGIGIGRAAPNSGLEIGYETTIDNDLHVLEDIDASGDITANGDVHCTHIYTNGWTWNELYDTFTWNRLQGGLAPQKP